VRERAFPWHSLDGILWSESRVLEQAMGMRRVVVDGNPKYRIRRLELAAEAIGVEAAVCNQTDTLHYAVSGPTSGLAEFMSDSYLRSYFPRVLQALENARHNWSLVDWGGVTLKIPPKEVACVPLQRILDHLGLRHVQFFVLDTEGSELNILKTIDWERMRFDLMVIESTAAARHNTGYAGEVVAYIHNASRGAYVAAHGGQHGEARGRDVWLRRRDFKPSKCSGLLDDVQLSLAKTGFELGK
jgi:hypothetical protein